MERRNQSRFFTDARTLGAVVTIFIILTAACAGADERPSLPVATFCPRSGRANLDRSDGAVIAVGLLTRSSDDVLFDPQEFASLTEELDHALTLIRADHHELDGISARDAPFIFGWLAVGLEPDLERQIHGLLAGRQETINFVTGNDEFDSLNARLGLTGVESMDGSALLCFSDLVNVPAAAEAYSGVKGIEYAEPDAIIGDGPDIDAVRSDDGWLIVFRDAWGEACPTGCTGEQLRFFSVIGEEVTEDTEAVSEADLVELTRLVRHR